MPYYPALPAVPSWREQENPVRDLAAGIETGQDIYGKALRSQAEAEAIQQMRTRREAMRQYQETGDPKTLYPALTPEQALVAPGQLAKQQADLANSAVQYWDATKPNLTIENYPAWREETLRRFPQVNQAMFPEPSTFRSNEDFQRWKYEREAMAARFKAMSQGAKLSGGYYIPPGGGSPQALPPRPVDEARAEYYKARIGQGERRLDIAEERVRQGRPAAGGSRTMIIPYDQWKRLPENAGKDLRDYNLYVSGVHEAVESGKKKGRGDKPLTPLQEEKLRQEKAKTKLIEDIGKPAAGEEGFIDKLYRLGGLEPPTPEAPTKAPGGKFQVRNRRTGKMEEVTEEQYNMIMNQGK